jgi:phage-related protein
MALSRCHLFSMDLLANMAPAGRDGIARAVYAAVQGRTLLVLHVFVKKTQATPRSAIETALKRLEEST